MPKYHFRTPDGQEHGWNGTLAKLKKEHPNATIVGRVEVDEVGQGRLVEYRGDQPDEDAASDANRASLSDDDAANVESVTINIEATRGPGKSQGAERRSDKAVAGAKSQGAANRSDVATGKLAERDARKAAKAE